MDVSLSKLERGTQVFRFEEELPRLIGRFGKVLIRATAQIEPRHGDYKLTGSYETDFNYPCDRCTEEIPTHVEGDVNLILVPESEDAELGEDVEFSADILDSETYHGHEIHLTTIFEDQLTLDLPMQLLCDPGCKGLCGNCKGDLNKGECSCGGINPSSPFAGLKDLLNP